jgi:hypothetical protein
MGTPFLEGLGRYERGQERTDVDQEGDNVHEALCPLSRRQNLGIMLDDGAEAIAQARTHTALALPATYTEPRVTHRAR